MVEMDLGMVNWARAQFAMTAMYHWTLCPHYPGAHLSLRLL